MNIRYTDIDFNSHVGNVNYVKWIIDSMPFEIVKDYRICEFKIFQVKIIHYFPYLR